VIRQLSSVEQGVVACGLIPIVRFERLQQAVGVAKALRDAEVTIVEFPMTSALALKAIEKTITECGSSMIVGAGTVLDVKTARDCISAGAAFIVSPCVNPAVIQTCRRLKTVVCPGALTPTEVYDAWRAGGNFIKVFPCNSVGSVSYIQSLKIPFPDIALIPVGGVTIANVGDFIKAGCCAVGVGAGIVDRDALKAERYDVVTKKASRYMQALRAAREER